MVRFCMAGWSYYLFSGDMIWHWDGSPQMPRSLVRSLPHWIANLIPRTWMNQIILSYSSLGLFEVRSHVLRIIQTLLVLVAAFLGVLICSVLAWRRRVRSTRIDSSSP